MIAKPDRVVFGTKNRGGRDQIGYAKRMPDGTTLYIEEARRGKKELATVSMRKFPATMDADSVAASLHLDAQNDGISPIVVRHPSADKNATLYQSSARIPGVDGKRTSLLTPNGSPTAQYRLVEASDRRRCAGLPTR